MQGLLTLLKVQNLAWEELVASTEIDAEGVVHMEPILAVTLQPFQQQSLLVI